MVDAGECKTTSICWLEMELEFPEVAMVAVVAPNQLTWIAGGHFQSRCPRQLGAVQAEAEA